MATVDAVKTKDESRSFLRRLWDNWGLLSRQSRVRTLAHVRFRLTREGIHFIGILAFIFVGAVIREISLLILLAGTMIGLLLLQWRFNTSTLVGLNVFRRLPRSATVGEAFDIELRLTNPKAWLSAWLVLVEDSLRKVAPEKRRLPEQGFALVDTVRPRGATDSRYRLKLLERGRYEIVASKISTRFPLGLGLGWRTIEASSSITVQPRQGELLPGCRSLFHVGQVGSSRSASKAAMQEGEFFGLRPWATGDSRRWIHWRTTARLGQLSVRQFEQQQQRQVTVVLDLAKVDEADANDVCEKAISFLATLASHTIRQGRERLSVAVVGKSVDCYPAIPSAIMVENLLNDLAVAEPDEEPDLLAALRGLSVPILNNPRVVVISTRPSMVDRLKSLESEGIEDRVLTSVRMNWVDVSAGGLEPYFKWIKSE
ncbi:MAG: DUF58 domain-containing protein [Planctomycetota bacterium]